MANFKGLSTNEAIAQLTKYGKNDLPEPRVPALPQKILGEIVQPYALLLIAASAVSFTFGEVINGSLISVVVCVNGFFNLYQNYKAEAALKKLKRLTKGFSRVIRNGHEIQLSSEQIVPEDLVFIEAGTKIPADGVILECSAFETNEATLTGESLPVVKDVSDEVWSGTTVAKGRALFKVVKTGSQTKVGQLALSLQKLDEEPTPLQRKLTTLSKQFGVFGIVISIVVFIFSFWIQDSLYSSLLLAISVAVAVVPEALPIVLTSILAVGSARMSGRGALIRKMSAIEALGSVSVIVTDKTGTLTTSKMRVKDIFFDSKNMPVDDLTQSTTLEEILTNSVVCSTASLVKELGGEYVTLGDTTEGALLIFAQEQGVDIQKMRDEHQILDEIPFSSETKTMSVRVKHKVGDVLYTKGAPESILTKTKYALVRGEKVAFGEKLRKEVGEVLTESQHDGCRTLAFAKDDIFLGFVSLFDPPRKEVAATIIQAQAAGIRTVMVTGDNEKTAQFVGAAIGFVKKGDVVLTGKQVDEFSDQELKEVLPLVKIFARTTPHQKARIVAIYQSLGEIVAVTGDGVNDAIALKKADVGVAMGRTGTDVAIESSDVVLTDDNYATLVGAIEEGRGIVKTIRNLAIYLFSTNVSEVAVLLLFLCFGISHVFLPTQLLYINLISDGLPAIMFAFAPKDGSIMKGRGEKILQLFGKREFIFIGFAATVITALTSMVYILTIDFGLSRSTAFFVITICQVFVFAATWIRARSILEFMKFVTSPLFLLAVVPSIALQVIIATQPFASGLFDLQPIPVFALMLLTTSVTFVMSFAMYVAKKKAFVSF